MCSGFICTEGEIKLNKKIKSKYSDGVKVEVIENVNEIETNEDKENKTNPTAKQSCHLPPPSSIQMVYLPVNKRVGPVFWYNTHHLFRYSVFLVILSDELDSETK